MPPSRKEIERYVSDKTDQLIAHVRDGGRLAVVKAPPGSGKTHLLMMAVKAAIKEKQRIAVATQTRAQADDICQRLQADFKLSPIRFAAASSTPPANGIQVVTEKKNLPSGTCVVVATTAKWGMLQGVEEFDVLFVDEAWQMSWADFMLLGQVSGRFVLIGDPGQIPPVVTIDTGRWETSPRAPHHPAPEHILRHKPRDLLSLDLPATRRLPHDTVGYIIPFYDFPFVPFAQPGERMVRAGGRSRDAIDAAIDRLSTGSVVALTLRTPTSGPPLEEDAEVAQLAADVAARLLKRETQANAGRGVQRLAAGGIGVCSTHRVMNAAVEQRLARGLKGLVRVDTPERWQGLQLPVMVIAHPLSGVQTPSEFDLETGRLCVMASRHQSGLIVVTRDHVGETLREHLPSAVQPVGRPDVSGRGHFQHFKFWDQLQQGDRIVEG